MPRCHAGLDHGRAATDVSGRSADTSVEAALSAEWDRSGAWAEVGAKIGGRPIPDLRLEIASG